MKKTQTSKLRLHRETLETLDSRQSNQAVGGLQTIILQSYLNLCPSVIC